MTNIIRRPFSPRSPPRPAGFPPPPRRRWAPILLAVVPVLGWPPFLFPEDSGREVVRLFIERERDRAEAQAFRQSLDIWAAYCRPRTRAAGMDRDLRRLQRWLDDPRDEGCLPPPYLCPPFLAAPYPPPYYYQRFIPRNYWRWWTKRCRELQLGRGSGVR